MDSLCSKHARNRSFSPLLIFRLPQLYKGNSTITEKGVEKDLGVIGGQFSFLQLRNTNSILQQAGVTNHTE